MPDQRFPIIHSALSPRKQEQFAESIGVLDAGLAAGEIANAHYVKAKEALSRALDYAWREAIEKPYTVNRDYRATASEAENRALRDLYGAPRVNTIAKMKRISDSIGDTPAGRAIRAILEEADTVLDMVRRGKEIAVKKRPAPREKTATERYAAPAASTTAMAAVLAELRGITEEARDGLVAALCERQQTMLRRFLEAQGNWHASGRFSVYNYAVKVGRGRADSYLRQKLDSLVTTRQVGGRKVYQPKPDVQEIIAREAAREADAICAGFIEKNLSKLAPIIERKGDFSSMEVIGRTVNPGAMEGRLRLRFEDGASFEARSRGVLSFSKYGKPFMRYPLTFHEVRMPDGSLMDRPSEKKMVEEFARTCTSPEP